MKQYLISISCLILMFANGVLSEGTSVNNDLRCFKKEDNSMELPSLSNTELIKIAEIEAQKIEYSLEGHVVETENLNGNFRVSFFVPNGFGGGLTVVIDRCNGKVQEVQMNQ